MRKTQVLFIFLSFILPHSLFAQNTSEQSESLLAIGLRVSSAPGVSVKYYLPNGVGGIELIGTTLDDGGSLTALYETYTDTFWFENFRALGGIGAHMNIYKNSFFSANSKSLGENHHYNSGIDLLLGFEYTIGELPFNLSVDWKPSLNLIGEHGLDAKQFALSVRFVFFN